ncbi:MAG TPA: redoxin domain-containing protein [Opitutaceae bacterium]|nr:redoxin domain-containing protein [Opitutaceae bacterium]
MKTLRLLSVMACCGLAVLASRASVAIGRAAPDFALTDLGGKTHRLSDYRGKVVVLEWNNPDCPIVHKHYDSGNMPRLQKSATAAGVIWLTINSSAPGKQGGDYTAGQIEAWLEERGAAPTDYFRDPDGRVGHLYGAKTTPHMFVIAPDGTLAYDGAIDSIPSADQSDIPHAENYVSEALAAVEAGKPVATATSRPYGCSVKY